MSSFKRIVFAADVRPTDFDDQPEGHYVTPMRLDTYDISPATSEVLSVDSASWRSVFRFLFIRCEEADLQVPLDRRVEFSRFELAFLFLRAKRKTRLGEPYSMSQFWGGVVRKLGLLWRHRIRLPWRHRRLRWRYSHDPQAGDEIRRWTRVGSYSHLYFPSRMALLDEFERKVAAHPSVNLPRRNAIEKLLIIYPDLIGDNITAAPILQAIKRAHPEVAIHYVTSPKGSVPYENCPYIDQLWIWDSPNANNHHGSTWDQKGEDRERIFAKLKAEDFDACLLFSTWPDRCIMTSRLDIPQTVVPGTMDILMHGVTEIDYGGKWIYQAHMDLARQLFPDLSEIPAHEYWWGEGVRESLLEEKQRPRLAVQTWAPYPTRRVPICSFLPLLRPYVERGWQLVVFDPSSRFWAQQDIPEEQLLFAGDLPLREAMDLMGTCDAFIGNDGGMGHVASMHGLPITVVFTTVEPGHWTPHSPQVRVVHPRIACRHCGLRTCNIGMLCFEDVTEQLGDHQEDAEAAARSAQASS